MKFDAFFDELEKLSSAVGVQVVDGKKRVLTEDEAREQLRDIQESLPQPNAVFRGLSDLFDPDVEDDEQLKLSGKKELQSNPVGANEYKDAKGGLTAAGRAKFKREEGADLKPGVKERNPTGERAKRKGSFLKRFYDNPRGPLKDEKGRPTRLALAAQEWGERPPSSVGAAKALASKGERLLEKSKEAQVALAALVEEIVKQADSSKPQWLELGYTEGERSMGNAPVLSRKKPGDAPTADTDAMSGPTRYDGGWSPPSTKVAAALGRAIHATFLDDGLGDAPERATPNPNRRHHETDRFIHVGSTPDVEPITTVEGHGAYSRD